MAALPSMYYGTSGNWANNGCSYIPPPSNYKTVSKEAFDAMAKWLTRQERLADDRRILRGISRFHEQRSRSMIQERRRFARIVGKRQTSRARRRNQ